VISKGQSGNPVCDRQLRLHVRQIAVPGMSSGEVPLVVTIIGYAAAFCSTVSFTPQAWKIIKSRNTDDLSAGMYALTVCGFGLWLAFGVLERQWPLIIANFICLVLSGFILLMKLLSRPQRNAVADALDPDSGDWEA
jgi:MtN3 and saliva related transmembrane protein